MLGAGADDHAAQAGMGVNEEVLVRSDREMELGGAGAVKKYVPGEDAPCGRFQAKGGRQTLYFFQPAAA